MDIIGGGAYQYLPENLRCVVDEVSPVSGRARVTLDGGRVVHEVPSHELGEALPIGTKEAAPEPEADQGPGLMTPRRFSQRLREGDVQAP